jgi:predicted PurR-regulated permease PerM
VVVFFLLGIPFPVLFAVALGISSLIPVVSGVLGIFLTVLLCLNSLAVGVKFFISAFIINQIVDNVVAPRLMGNLIGLNPIWLLISLFIGAQVGGILGLLLAVPIASVIKRVIDDLRTPPVSFEP